MMEYLEEKLDKIREEYEKAEENVDNYLMAKLEKEAAEITTQINTELF